MKGRKRMIFGSSSIYLILTRGSRSRDGMGFEPSERNEIIERRRSVL